MLMLVSWMPNASTGLLGVGARVVVVAMIGALYTVDSGTDCPIRSDVDMAINALVLFIVFSFARRIRSDVCRKVVRRRQRFLCQVVTSSSLSTTG